MGTSIVFGLALLIQYNLEGLSDILVESAKSLQEAEGESQGVLAGFNDAYFRYGLGYLTGFFIISVGLLSLAIPMKILLNIPGFFRITKFKEKKHVKNSDYKYYDFPSN